ncbi:MAG TPA: hypothetical protein VHO91_19430 [Rhodopila sp.]|nr:hypothetical protein [Rhodopila sp.]
MDGRSFGRVQAARRRAMAFRLAGGDAKPDDALMIENPGARRRVGV